MRRFLLLASLVTITVCAADLDLTPSPEGANVYIVSPANGETVSSPVRIVFGLQGMGIAPAGTNAPNTGHHHLVVDAQLPDMTAVIPANANYIHYGGGQTETDLELEPGEHTLRLVLGDFRHIPHDPPVYSEEVRITVR